MIDGSAITLALAAGLIAALNPCGFALLPAYLTLLVATNDPDGDSRPAAIARALRMSAAMTIGFVAVFGGFGLVVVPLTLSVERYLPWVTVVIGLALVALGVWLLLGRELFLPTPRLRGGAPSTSMLSMAGYGIAYAVASLSCTAGPFLAVTVSTFRASGLLAGLATFVAYAIGMGLVVGFLAVLVALARNTAVSRMRQLLPYVSRASGALLVMAGLYVAYYCWYELRVFAGGSTEDPVIDAALAIQGALARFVAELGAGWIAALFGVIVVGVLGVTVARRLRRRAASEGAAGNQQPDSTRR